MKVAHAPYQQQPFPHQSFNLKSKSNPNQSSRKKPNSRMSSQSIVHIYNEARSPILLLSSFAPTLPFQVASSLHSSVPYSYYAMISRDIIKQ